LILEEEWEVKEEEIQSKSKNTPFYRRKLKGKVRRPFAATDRFYNGSG